MCDLEEQVPNKIKIINKKRKQTRFESFPMHLKTLKKDPL